MTVADLLLPVLAAATVLVAGRRSPSRRRPARSPRRPNVARRPRPALPRGVAVAMVVAAAGLALVVLGSVAGSCLVVGLVLGRARLVRSARLRRQRAVAAAVPDLVDLFVLAASAGHAVPGALVAVTERAPPAVRPVLEAACRQVQRGVPVADALAGVGDQLGPWGATLAEVLVGGHRTGSPLAPVLARTAEAARDARRRQAEEAARRLPVTLLFPLVCCVLPAFGLLAVVPLLAASLGSLRG